MKDKHFQALTANFVIITMIAVTFCLATVLTIPDVNNDLPVNAIYNGNTSGQSVAFMFNVYEHTENVMQIAKILKEKNCNATFFVGGSWVARNPDALLKLYSDGFEIGNHGYLHRDHAKLNAQQNRDEIVVTERMIKATLSSLLPTASTNTHDAFPNYTTKLFAPPSGSIGGTMFSVCKQLDYKVILWTRDTIDWRDQNEDLIYNRAIKGIKAGDLVLMHPTNCTAKVLSKIVDYTLSHNLKISTVSQTLE